MFRSTSTFDKYLDKATSHLLLEPDLLTTIQICDTVRQGDCNAKYAVAAIKKKLYHANPHVIVYALGVLESLVKNCGSPVHDEIGTKQFMEDLRELVRSANNDAVRTKVLELIQTWAHAFRNSPKYRPVVDTFNIMKAEGYSFPPLNTTSDAMFAADVAPEWADGDVCHRCRTAFSVMVRKHHCRACGQVFCGKCSSEACTLPKFGIEKEVRVCDACYEQHGRQQEGGSGGKDDSLEAFAAKVVQAQSSPTRSPAPPRKSAEELQEEEELQLAIALSQSEAEEKNKRRTTTTFSPRKEVSPTPMAAPEVVDPELARYLNRSYWENRDAEREREKPSAPQAQQITQAPPTATTPVMSPTTPTKITEQYQNGESDPMDEFVQRLRGQVEMFVNRLRSNSARGRWVANDSSVQSLFMSLTQAHPNLLQHITALDDQRMNLEHLQDKLTQARDNRAALDALREEHRDRRRRELEEAERTRQLQMAHKLEIMRLKKQEYLQYQRELAMQRIKEQERERQMRLEQQKAQYLRGGYPPPPNMPYMSGPYMEAVPPGFPPAPMPHPQHPQHPQQHPQHPQQHPQHPQQHPQHPQQHPQHLQQHPQHPQQHPQRPQQPQQHPQAPPPEQMPPMAYGPQPHYNMYMPGPPPNMPGMGYPLPQHPGPVPSGPPPQPQAQQPMPAPAPVENIQTVPATQPSVAELISFD